MKKARKKDIPLTPEQEATIELKTFFDMAAPNSIKFNTDYYICGNTYRCVWSIIGFIYSTENFALLSELAAKSGISIHIRHHALSVNAEDKVIANAEQKNAQGVFSKNLSSAISAKEDARELAALLQKKRKDKEPLLDISVFIEMKAETHDALLSLQQDVKQLLSADKIEYDRMLSMQKEGFLAVLPGGIEPVSLRNKRIYPASSAANLFPFAYSGKLDEKGFRLGKDKHGGDIIVDLDARASDKTNGHAIILGNSGEGKSYLTKLLFTFSLESNKNVIIIDPTGEYKGITEKLGGAYIDIASGYIINPLEVRDQAAEEEMAFYGNTVSRHIAFLRDFFSTYKKYTQAQLDTIEILLKKLYQSFGITDMSPSPHDGKWPVLSDLYTLVEKTYTEFRNDSSSTGVLTLTPLTQEVLREVLLGITGICTGADSRYFNGQTNIPDSRIVSFGFKKLLDTNENLLSAALFNALSYMHNALMTHGNTVGIIDELHMFLRYPVAINYIRADIKQGRKKDSSLILATQNIEDMLLPGIRELTKPLFTIPTHSFLFYPGNVNATEYMDLTNLLPEEFTLIRSPRRGQCLYRCGNERFLLQVQASPAKAALIGNSGGR